MGDAGVDNWVNLFKVKNNVKRNPDCPTVAPWRVVTPINTPLLTMERNPYYFAVDTDGNQLPYIDKIQMTLAENLEVLNLRAIAGEYDFQVRHIDIAKMPAFKENEQKGNYTVKLWPWLHGTDAGLFVNQNYDADPEIRKLLTSRDFRVALSLGIDRVQLNEAFWLGLGQPGSAVPTGTPISPGPEYRTLHATLAPDQANALLDGLGLDKRDSDSYRLRTDGKGRLTLDLTTVGATFVNFTGIAEMVAEHWRKHLGIRANVKQVERSLLLRQTRNNELQIRVWSNDGSEDPFTFPFFTVAYHPDNSAMAPLSALWYQSGGQQGVKPEGGLLRQLELLDRAKAVPAEERTALGKEILRILGDEVYIIGTVGVSPALMGVAVTSNRLGNVPDRVPGSSPAQSPGNARPEQFYFKS